MSACLVNIYRAARAETQTLNGQREVAFVLRLHMMWHINAALAHYICYMFFAPKPFLQAEDHVHSPYPVLLPCQWLVHRWTFLTSS